jgi:hypothetical protein
VHGSDERALARAETQAWTEIAKKPLRRPSPALAVAAPCQTARRTCSSSPSEPSRRLSSPRKASYEIHLDGNNDFR